MDIKDIGHVVADRRTALGLSQEQLAHIAGLSRATINELERGSIGELGVTKLAGVLAVLGLDLAPVEKKARKNGLSMAAITASVSYRESLSPGALMKALASGVYAPALLPHIATLLDEVPFQILVPAVREAAEKSGVAPKKIWRHLKRWAEELKSPRRVWL
jgi:transcriptional regulator with XRE-family HTH domain